MNLIKEHWQSNDIKEFQIYLKSFEDKIKQSSSVDVLKTTLPVLCMKTVDLKYVVGEIYKGNYLEFLDLMIWEYYENTAINGFLINCINDFDIKKKYLDIYGLKADNWATCDLLTFNILGNEKRYFDLATIYCSSDLPFVKRIGINILFHYIDTRIIDIFNILDSFEFEDNYYVNMINAWLLSECFIKNREATLKYLQNNKLNKFTINKGIQKCRESRRVDISDKNMLLQYKIK